MKSQGGKSRGKRRKISQVKSGIALSTLVVPGQEGQAAPEESFLTSRTARVLLAGAGFLADAVGLSHSSSHLKLSC